MFSIIYFFNLSISDKITVPCQSLALNEVFKLNTPFPAFICINTGHLEFDLFLNCLVDFLMVFEQFFGFFGKKVVFTNILSKIVEFLHKTT